MNWDKIKERYSSVTEVSKEEYEAARERLPESDFKAKYSKSSYSPPPEAYIGGAAGYKEFTHYYKTDFNSEQAMMFIMEAIRKEARFTQKIYTLLIVEAVVAAIAGLVLILTSIL